MLYDGFDSEIALLLSDRAHDRDDLPSDDHPLLVIGTFLAMLALGVLCIGLAT